MSIISANFETYVDVKFKDYNCEFKFYVSGTYNYRFGYFEYFEIELEDSNCPDEYEEIEEELVEIAKQKIERNISAVKLVEEDEIEIEF